MARGGKRIGAGRPKDSKEKQTLVKEQALLVMREMVMKEIGPLTDVLIKKGKDGDIQAIRELFDRAFGKAPQAITGEDGGPLQIVFDESFKHKTNV